jgi:4-hydroxy-3-polyprenylbenzoate decarboxylase
MSFIPVTSLRQWLETLEAHDLLVRVQDPIDINHIAAATAANYRRASLFERVVGYDIPVATNVVSNRAMLALALGVGEEALLSELQERLRHRIAPVRVTDGPCKEVVLTGDAVDLTRFPIHLQHELDGAPYITAGVLAARHPLTGVPNVGIYRMMFRTRRETGIDLTAPHKLRRYYQLACEAKRPLEVACALGLHGVDLVGSVATAPEDVDEYEVMGALRRQPVELVRCETIDVEVPADSEIVLECEMPPDGWTEDEGPYGEFTGTYGGLKRNPVLRVKAITHRRQPIFLSATHGGFHPGWTDFYLLVPLFELTIANALRAANIDVRGIRFHPASSGMWAIVSIKQWSAGDARNALHLVLAASNQNFPKYAVVVDEDIDVFDDEQVYWAMTWRTQAHEDMHVFTGMKCIPLDPSLPTEMPPVTTSKMGIDATIPPGRERLRFTVCRPPFMAEAARLFGRERATGD